MSTTITLAQIDAAILDAFPHASAQEQGAAIAAVIKRMGTPKAEPKAVKAPVKPKPAKKAATIADPAVGTGEHMRMTLAGRPMPTNRTLSAKSYGRITAFSPKEIKAALRALKISGSIKSLNVADASDLYTTLKAA